MKKVILSLFVVAIVSLVSVQSSYAGIPISDVQEAVVTESTTGPTVIEQQSEIQKTKTTKTSRKAKRAAAAGGKSQLIALLLCFFLGALGIHRFYLGYMWQGVVQLLTAGGLGIWVLIDFIRIIMGTLEPKNGPYDSTL